MGFNVRYINSELEDLDVEDRITPQSYTDLPIHFSDGNTHLVVVDKEVPEHDTKYHNIGNFTWEIYKENNIPTKVILTYPIIDKTLEEVKQLKKQEVAPVRREKENTIITVNVNSNFVEVSTSREERLLLTSKIAAGPGPYNYKFKNIWLEVTSQDLQTVVNSIDLKVQEAFDWEFTKLQEIDACQTIDDVYNVEITQTPKLVNTKNTNRVQ